MTHRKDPLFINSYMQLDFSRLSQVHGHDRSRIRLMRGLIGSVQPRNAIIP